VESKWLSIEDVCSYLGVGHYTIYKWIKRKGLPAHKLGKAWRFDRAEIDRWAELIASK